MSSNLVTVSDLDAARRDVETALDRYQRNVQYQLLRPDGSPRYTPQEHAEREAELRKPLETACQQAQALAEKARAIARAYVEDLQHGDGLTMLNDGEVTRAAAAASFVREDLASMDLAALLGRLNSAARTPDRVSAWLAVRYAPQRLAELRQQATSRGELTLLDSQRLAAADEAIRALAGTVQDPARLADAQKAEALSQKARQVDGYSRQAWDQASGETARRIEQKRRSGEYSF